GVAARLRAVGRSGDIIARLHGAEFAVVLHGLRSSHGVTAATNELIAVLAEPLTVSSVPVVVEARAGYSYAPEHGDDAVTLLRRARLALFDARSQERPSSGYEPALDSTSDTGLQVIADLRRAIDEHELVLHYQPKFELRGGRPAGAEALVRWQHPERGMVPPMEFVGTVERSPLIRDFTLYVLDAAIAECATWDALAAPVPVAVNLSPRSLLDPDLPEQVERVLRRHGLAPHRLILEITETIAVSDLEIVSINLARLRGMGILLSLDDFGTGFSSISLLTRQSVDELKIDREFVSKMTPGSRAATLVENLVKLAHGFDLTVVAEGVENEEQQNMLRAFGCDHAQGFHLARPMPADQVRAVLAKASADAAVSPTGRPTGTIDGEHVDRMWKDRWTTNQPQ
ncbi:MAG: diguanylate cyclase, partial [Frankiaceae bacterium]|nr:diguanylate cyclase [Frankiaceae bacterium]